MPTDLDARIRGLVMEIVEHAPPAPELVLAAEQGSPPRRRSRTLAVLGILIVVALIASAIAFVNRDETTTISPARRSDGTVRLALDSIPKGVSTDLLRKHPVFLVRSGRHVSVFTPDRGETELLWCEAEKVFASPDYNTLFDTSGRSLGEDVSGLDRFGTRVSDDAVTVDLGIRIEGLPARSPTTASWKTHSKGFCRDRRTLRGRPVNVRLSTVSPGVSTRKIAGTPVFLVRAGNRVTTFVSSAQHLRGEWRLWWCADWNVFYSPTHGETFDRDGRIVGGPARRGLDRFKTTVRDGLVTIDRRRIVKGSTTRPLGGGVPAAPCENPVVSGP